MMAHWETITHALHRAGGGPLRRVEFDGEFESDTAAIAGIRRALVLGLVAVHGCRWRGTWTITQRGIDWCMGRVALVSRSWRRAVETDDERQKRIDRLVAASHEAYEACTRLTTRQKEILILMAKGFTRGEIAKLLGIKPGSVATRTARICQAIGCARNIEAVGIATKAGIS